MYSVQKDWGLNISRNCCRNVGESMVFRRRVGKMWMELRDAEKSSEGVREKHSQTVKWWKQILFS